MKFNKIFKVILLAYTSLFLLGLSDNIRGPLYPEILETFSLNDSQGALFFSMSSALGIFGSYLAGRLYVGWGALQTLRMSFVILILGQIMIAAAPTYLLLLVGVCFMGLSLGLMGVIQNTLIVQEIPHGPLKNRMLSGLHSMYAGASLVAPLLVNLIAVLSFSLAIWRSVFLAGALLALLVLVLSYWGGELPKSTQPLRTEPAHSAERWAQIYFGIALSTYVLSEILVSTRMALYMRREFDADLSESTWYTALFFIGLLGGRLLFSFWAPKASVRSQLIVCLFLTLLSLLVGIYLHPLGLAVSSLFMAPFYPLMMVAAGQLFPFSVSQTLSWAIGLSSLFIVLMHFFVGAMTDQFGLPIAFLTAPFFILTSMVMILFYEKIFRRLQHSF